LVPTGQNWHKADEAFAKVPAAHGVHAALLTMDTEPGMHVAQEMEFCAEKVPGRQALQTRGESAVATFTMSVPA
jgi:hypothetical protein